MKCPFCENPKTNVTESRDTDDGASIRRRRQCLSCGKRFTTYETVEHGLLRVVKKDGTREMFDRNKLRNGIVRACEKRHISTEQIENMVNAVEHKVRNDSHQEVSTEMIGACVMDELKKVDQVAYVRFASVYREFKDISSFMSELKALMDTNKSKEPSPKRGVEMDSIEKGFADHARVLEETKALIPVVREMADVMSQALHQGHKILICGNGGSAADAQHIAAEFIGRFHNERISLPAVALTVDTSILTSVANDYSYDVVFSRQVEGLGQEGDVLWGITTSGNSGNVIKAVEAAKKKGLKTIVSSGKDGGAIRGMADISLVIPSDVTARIQEMHMLCAHLICEIIDEESWGNE